MRLVRRRRRGRRRLPRLRAGRRAARGFCRLEHVVPWGDQGRALERRGAAERPPRRRPLQLLPLRRLARRGPRAARPPPRGAPDRATHFARSTTWSSGRRRAAAGGNAALEHLTGLCPPSVLAPSSSVVACRGPRSRLAPSRTCARCISRLPTRFRPLHSRELFEQRRDLLGRSICGAWPAPSMISVWTPGTSRVALDGLLGVDDLVLGAEDHHQRHGRAREALVERQLLA